MNDSTNNIFDNNNTIPIPQPNNTNGVNITLETNNSINNVNPSLDVNNVFEINLTQNTPQNEIPQVNNITSINNIN